MWSSCRLYKLNYFPSLLPATRQTSCLSHASWTSQTTVYNADSYDRPGVMELAHFLIIYIIRKFYLNFISASYIFSWKAFCPAHEKLQPRKASKPSIKQTNVLHWNGKYDHWNLEILSSWKNWDPASFLSEVPSRQRYGAPWIPNSLLCPPCLLWNLATPT